MIQHPYAVEHLWITREITNKRTGLTKTESFVAHADEIREEVADLLKEGMEEANLNLLMYMPTNLSLHRIPVETEDVLLVIEVEPAYTEADMIAMGYIDAPDTKDGKVEVDRKVWSFLFE